MSRGINPYGTLGFGLAAVFAVVEDWSLPEFCWGTWMAGLVYTWVCILTAAIQIILTARSEKTAYEKNLPFLRRFTPLAFLLGTSVAAVLAGLIAFRIFSYLFAFYGLFLSAFAEMEPHALFGRNGFINSDFYTPVTYLVEHFWPMALAALVANWEDFFRRNPWKRVFLPFEKEIVRLHIMTLALPFISLFAWILFREAYQTITIVLLMGLLYLLPKRQLNQKPAAQRDSKPSM